MRKMFQEPSLLFFLKNCVNNNFSIISFFKFFNNFCLQFLMCSVCITVLILDFSTIPQASLAISCHSWNHSVGWNLSTVNLQTNPFVLQCYVGIAFIFFPNKWKLCSHGMLQLKGTSEMTSYDFHFINEIIYSKSHI